MPNFFKLSRALGKYWADLSEQSFSLRFRNDESVLGSHLALTFVSSRLFWSIFKILVTETSVIFAYCFSSVQRPLLLVFSTISSISGDMTSFSYFNRLYGSRNSVYLLFIISSLLSFLLTQLILSIYLIYIQIISHSRIKLNELFHLTIGEGIWIHII